MPKIGFLFQLRRPYITPINILGRGANAKKEKNWGVLQQGRTRFSGERVIRSGEKIRSTNRVILSKGKESFKSRGFS